MLKNKKFRWRFENECRREISILAEGIADIAHAVVKGRN